jgi:hypothetical protein
MAPKGHFPQASHRALLAQLEAIMPKPATVTFLGDGEFDGVELQADLRHTNWLYVCRTASTILFSACGFSSTRLMSDRRVASGLRSVRPP